MTSNPSSFRTFSAPHFTRCQYSCPHPFGIAPIAVTPTLTNAADAKPAPATRPARAPAPARDPNTPGYVTAKELPDGTIPPSDADGNFIIGPTHKRAPEMTEQADVPHGTIINL